MVSSSRFNAKPTMPPSNCSISLTAASGKPDTLAMPSPTSTTRPTWPEAKEGSKPSKFFLIAVAISCVFIVSSAISKTPLEAA